MKKVVILFDYDFDKAKDKIVCVPWSMKNL